MIDARDKEIMVASMKRLIEDMNKVELILADIQLKPDQLHRIYQFMNNNKLRARKVIWGLTVSRIRDAKDTDYLSDLEQKDKVMNTEEDEGNDVRS
jgi:hypothetical protein